MSCLFVCVACVCMYVRICVCECDRSEEKDAKFISNVLIIKNSLEKLSTTDLLQFTPVQDKLIKINQEAVLLNKKHYAGVFFEKKQQQA